MDNGEEIINAASRLNFMLLSSFNIIILCPVEAADCVRAKMVEKGATLVQQGFLHNQGKKHPTGKGESYLQL